MVLFCRRPATEKLCPSRSSIIWRKTLRHSCGANSGRMLAAAMMPLNGVLVRTTIQENASPIMTAISVPSGRDDPAGVCDLVIEAIIEQPEAKRALYAEVEPRLKPDALLTTNTSSIPIMKLAAVTPNPERVAGMHFFNPVHLMRLVEIVVGRETSSETVETVREAAGVVYTLGAGDEPSSTMELVNFLRGHRLSNVVFITGSYGLGENVVQGTVDPDEYQVFKPLLADQSLVPVIEEEIDAVFLWGDGVVVRLAVDLKSRGVELEELPVAPDVGASERERHLVDPGGLRPAQGGARLPHR